jgi:hypothetical protein
MASEMTWKTVSDENEQGNENKVLFDKINDQFIGKFLGLRKVEPSDGSAAYQQARWEANGPDGPNTVYFTNAGYSLRQGLKGVRPGSMTRVTFVSEQDTGQESLMKIMRVEVAATPRTATRAVAENS